MAEEITTTLMWIFTAIMFIGLIMLSLDKHKFSFNSHEVGIWMTWGGLAASVVTAIMSDRKKEGFAAVYGL